MNFTVVRAWFSIFDYIDYVAWDCREHVSVETGVIKPGSVTKLSDLIGVVQETTLKMKTHKGPFVDYLTVVLWTSGNVPDL